MQLFRKTKRKPRPKVEKAIRSSKPRSRLKKEKEEMEVIKRHTAWLMLVRE